MQPTSELWKLVESFGKILGFATAVLLVLSTAYDFSFLYALGLSFEELPSTLTDHVRSAIIWAPRALIYLGILLMYEMFMRRVEGGQSEEELIARSPTPRFTRALRKGPKVIFSILITIIIVSEFLLSTSDQGLFVVALALWGLLAFSVVEHHRLGARFTPTAGRLFIMIPIVIIWVASLGYVRGNTMMRETIPTWSVELKGSGFNENRKLVGLRRFSTTAILVESGRRVSVLPEELIVRADILRNLDADSPRICRWFGVSCVKAVAKP
jgi:hypothetical protein